MIEVSAFQKLGGFTLDASFTADSRFIALFGHSGSGKTTLLNVVAGLLRPERGRVIVDGATLFDADRGVFLPPYRRQLGTVFQEGRLFPHLSVRQNLLYGAWFARLTRKQEKLARIADLLGIEHLLGRYPNQLSGGEKQRVAIGRAILASPKLLLMDEPLASLDDPRKQEIMPYLERLRDEARIPIIYVSHSVAEVARLADVDRSIPFIEAHHHLWELDRFPYGWLRDPGNPGHNAFIGEYKMLRQDWGPARLFREFYGQNVIKSVHVEGDSNAPDPVGRDRLARHRGATSTGCRTRSSPTPTSSATAPRPSWTGTSRRRTGSAASVSGHTPPIRTRRIPAGLRRRSGRGTSRTS